jgi:hypothetical protein
MAALAVAAAFGGGRWLAQAPGQLGGVAQAASREAAGARPAATSAISADLPMQVELTPKQVSRANGRDELVVDLRIANLEESAKDLTYSTGVYDDHGKLVGSLDQSPKRSLSGRRQAKLSAAATVAGLPNGFYQLVAEVAYREPNTAVLGSMDTRLYLHVENGAIHLMDAGDWVVESDASTAQQQ